MTDLATQMVRVNIFRSLTLFYVNVEISATLKIGNYSSPRKVKNVSFIYIHFNLLKKCSYYALSKKNTKWNTK